MLVLANIIAYVDWVLRAWSFPCVVLKYKFLFANSRTIICARNKLSHGGGYYLVNKDNLKIIYPCMLVSANGELKPRTSIVIEYCQCNTNVCSLQSIQSVRYRFFSLSSLLTTTLFYRAQWNYSTNSIN